MSRPDNAVDVLIVRLDPELPLPGLDWVTSIDAIVPPGERVLLPTGIAIALPSGYAAFVHPRSGLAVKHGVSLVNAPGTIDAGYRGEISVCLINQDPREPLVLTRGDRVAQLVIQRVEHAILHEVESLPGTDRGSGGFGSTGR